MKKPTPEEIRKIEKELLEPVQIPLKITYKEVVRDINERPILVLVTSLDSVVNTPTQEDYLTIMRIYDCGGWRLLTKTSPLYVNCFNINGKDSCFRIQDLFTHASSNFYRQQKLKIISPNEFYKMQGISPHVISEINKYFEKRKK